MEKGAPKRVCREARNGHVRAEQLDGLAETELRRCEADIDVHSVTWRRRGGKIDSGVEDRRRRHWGAAVAPCLHLSALVCYNLSQPTRARYHTSVHAKHTKIHTKSTTHLYL